MALDFVTLLVLNLIVDVINLAAMTLLWFRHRHRYRGLGYWTAAMAVHVPGIAIVLARAELPLFFPAVLANGLLMSSTILMLMGFQRFTGIVTRQTHNVAIFAAYLLSLHYFSAFVPSIDARNICSSTLILVVNAQTCWLLFRKVPVRMRRITAYAGLLMASYVAVSLVRIGILAASFRAAEPLGSGVADSVAIAGYIALHICLIIALSLTIVRRLTDDVLANEEKFAKAFELAPYALIIARRDDWRVVEVNAGFSGMFGLGRAEALGRTLPELLPPPGGGLLPVQAFAAADRGEKREITALRRSGEVMTGQLVSEDIVIDGQPHVLSTIDDVTEESRLRRRLEELAATDSLTGLPNRRRFAERFGIALQNARRHRTRMAVMSMDLDRFKSVNDSLGHAAGDAVLVEAARRLTGSLRQADVVARFGGDEFVVLLTEVGGLEDAAGVAEKIVTAFRRPFELPGRQVSLTASLGLAVYPDYGEGLEVLLRRSDEALYATKRAGRDGYRVWREPAAGA
jgi:diguanylate cyclase (GGDEF)-like protein/PAS domain S-box-containing protein